MFSKEFLVFNEEILIFVSFIIFMYLCYHFLGQSLSKELNERNLNIQKNFLYYDRIQKDLICSLIFFHKNQQNMLLDIQNIILFLKGITALFSEKFLILLKKHIFYFFENNLKKFLSLEKTFKMKLQYNITNFIIKLIHINFLSNKQKINYRLFIKNSIFSINNKRFTLNV